MTDLQNSHQYSWTWMAVIGLALCAYAIIGGHSFIFGPPVLETGDFAANALQIIDASHFRDIYGNYSRWGFNHPGPFFFYVYSLGEIFFFNGLNLVHSPHQAHVLAGIILQAIFISYSICEFTRITQYGLSRWIFLACCAFIMPHAQAVLSSIWPPDVLFGPYLALIMSCTALSLGYISALPVAVLTTCILCHGHIAQPLMTIPLLAIASAKYYLGKRHEGFSLISALRKTSTWLILSLCIIAIFILPLVVDLFRCPYCNAYRIIEYFHKSETTPNIRQALNYISSYIFFDHSPQWINDQPHIPFWTKRVGALLICLVALILSPRLIKKRTGGNIFFALSAAATFTIIALILSIAWGKRITGPLYEFNSFFVYAILLSAYTVILTSISLLFNERRRTQMTFIVAITIAMLLYKNPPPSVWSSPYVLQTTSERADKSKIALINQDDGNDWTITAALALWLARQNITFYVPGNWAYVFGWNHAANADLILRLHDKLQLWEPTVETQKLIGNTFISTFSPSAYCHLTDSSQMADITVQPMPLNDLRKKCLVTTQGLGRQNDDGWGWTQGHVVVIQFVGSHAEQNVHLIFNVFPYLGDGKIKKQTVHLYVNGEKVGSSDISGERILDFDINPSLWNSSKLITVILELPDATSPAQLGLSSDGRLIGLGLRGMGVSYGDASR